MTEYQKLNGRGNRGQGAPGGVQGRGWRIYLALAALLILMACGWAGGLSEAGRDAGGNGNAAARPITRTLKSRLALENTVLATDVVAPVETVAPTAEPVAPEVVLSPETLPLQNMLTTLYEQTNPAVVYILVTRGAASLPTYVGSGSGFVYSPEGIIITNHHVVAPGDRFEIVFWNGDRSRASLLGADPDSDLALLQVERLPEGSNPLPLADSSTFEVGQFVVAIGSPFGAQGSMSLGIVSGLGRSLPSQRATATGSSYSLPQVIQIDAPINPGNSGGPLLNLKGEVMGVNAAIATTTGTNSGVGFAIPVDVVRRVVPALLEEGRVVYPYMGMAFDGELTLDDQDFYGLSQTRGAYVVTVVPGSPADLAGLVAANPQTGRDGDLVIAVDGRPIQDFADLNSYLVLETQVGQTMELTVLRGDETLVLSLRLGERP
jgi:S1-C subfamily serine protease